jgi:dipeptidase
MHAGLGPIRASQTTGSMVTSVSKQSMEIWFTGASSPCLSMFMPYQFGFEHPIINQQPDKVYEPDSYWWQQEIMNRLAIFCNNEILSKYRSELFEREKQLLISFEPVNKLTKDEVQVLINEAATESLLIRDKWKKDFEKSYALSNKSLFHQIAWKNFNKSANLKIN